MMILQNEGVIPFPLSIQIRILALPIPSQLVLRRRWLLKLELISHLILDLLRVDNLGFDLFTF